MSGRAVEARRFVLVRALLGLPSPWVRFFLPPDRGAVRARARAAVLAEWMTAWSGTVVEVRVATSYRDLVLAVERGEADLAWAPPAVVARAQASIRGLLTAVRYGRTACRAMFVVHSAATMRSVEDLRGRRAVWVDALSTSGYLSPQLHLRARGLDPQRLFASQSFAGSYRDALQQVLDGDADVTSVFQVNDSVESTLRELLDLVGETGRKLAVLEEATEAAPFDALVIPRQGEAPMDLERRILALDQRSRPPAMLLEMCRADRFVRGEIEAYRTLDRVLDAVLMGF